MLAIKIDTTKGPVIISTTYLPPRRRFFPVAELKRIFQKDIAVYMIADMNGRLRSLGYITENTNGKEIAKLMRHNICKHLGPDFDTLIHSRNKGRPDIILGNNKANMYNAIYQGGLTTSDHIPVIVELSTQPIMIKIKPRWNLKRTNLTTFKENIATKMSNNENEIRNKTNITKKWLEDIKDEIERNTPKVEYKLIPEIKESDRLKLLEQHYTRLRFQSSTWDRDQVRMIRNLQQQLSEEINRVSETYWNNKIAKLQDIYNEPEKFWRQIRNMKGTTTVESPYLVDNHNNKIHKNEDKLELHRQFWQNVFQINPEENINYDQQHENEINTYINNNIERIKPFESADLTRLSQNNIMIREIAVNDIKRIIKSFKNNKAPGKSGINKQILENLPEIGYENFQTILNLTISMGYFPIVLKEGIIILILKPGKDPTKAASYRPITLLEVPGNILEKLINERVYGFAERNNLFHQQQFGFRKARITETAITKIYEKIAINQRKRSQCNIVCRDIEKSFDKVWHKDLKFKILNMNMPNILEKITCNFLDDRKVAIKSSDSISNKIEIKSGVPQGSNLSPTLFILYTSDLPPPGPGTTDVLFADDITQVVEYHHKSKAMLALRTKREIKRVNDFEKKWKIKTSSNKFKILSISKSKPEKIIINDNEISFANSITVLGLNIT